MSESQHHKEPRRRSALSALAVVTALAVVAVVSTTTAGANSPQVTAATGGQRFVPEVESAFRSLSRRPDALAIKRTMSPPGTICKHYQGLARTEGPDGTPYMIMTKSGNDICAVQSDEPGWLVVAKLGSRPHHGERLRTNVLPPGTRYDDIERLNQDTVVAARTFDGEDLPAYGHPGGMQVIGDTLVVGADTPYGGERTSSIFFFDISNPEQPTLTSRLVLEGAGTDFTADPVGITAVRSDDGKCCRYLMIAAGGAANEDVRFFRSLPTEEDGTTDLLDGSLQWTQVGRYSDNHLTGCIGATWPTSGLIQGGQHQMLNFVREGELDGQLYLVGGRRDGTIATPDSAAGEYLDLYRMNVSSTGDPGDCPFTHVVSRFVLREPWGNLAAVSSLSASSGVYISPSGELIVYAGRHDAKLGSDDDDYILFGEYRHHGVVRADSPTLHPTASLNGPFVVDEGSTTTLAGSGSQAITKAFIELFEDDDAGASVPNWYDADQWLIVDYEDRDAANFSDLATLGGAAGAMAENVGSWRWFAPEGCTISANDYPLASGNWPGEHTVLLRGTGAFHRANDLDHLSGYHPSDVAPWALSPSPNPAHEVGYDDDVEGITFFHPELSGSTVARRYDCEHYYNTAIGLQWDIDDNGSYDATGTSVPFSAAGLDGPGLVGIAARAQHPEDTTPLGTGERLAATVTVRNVAPVIGAVTATDSLGADLTGTGTFAVVGFPVSLEIAFVDPGLADTQTGAVSWGDGNAETAIDVDDATGGATGRLHASHAFALPGSITIQATVTDDDGGATTVTRTVDVLSLEDAIRSLAERLTVLISGATNPLVSTALRSARDELIGNRGGQPPTNGAADKLASGEPSAAITKLRSAIGFMITAEARGGPDLSQMKGVAGLVAEAIATGEFQRARARVGASPSAGQAKTLATISALIAAGHEKLTNAAYLAACDSFKQATDKSAALKR